jgi:Cof subfamily protein (haloacid dehalogenase superfamily)
VTAPIRLVVSDVDGTLVTSDKALTDASIAAVHRLYDSGIRFAVTSGRPPRGMGMLIEPLALREPIGGFNGGLMVRPDLSVLEERTVPSELVAEVIAVLDGHCVDVWCYVGNDWLVHDPDRPHVAREAATVAFEPTICATYEGLTENVVKVVGVSDDTAAIAAAEDAMHAAFGTRLAASTSQPYYLDVTHPEANKGSVVTYLATALGILPEEIATIGDGPNDVLMFEVAGCSIAMGNANDAVRRSATYVTSSNDEDGLAHAIDRFILAAPSA